MNTKEIPIIDEQENEEYGKIFDKIEKPLKELLDEFEWQEYVSTGMKSLNMGYACTELEDIYGGWVYITLRWGINGEVEHIENYKISVADVLADIPVRKKLEHIYEE